jgi:S-formylglutathione hydrolase FrmB
MRTHAAVSLALGLAVVSGARASDDPAAVRLERVETANLDAPAGVVVHLPPSYEASGTRRYPVLYFLHDGQGDERTLLRRGIAARLLFEMRSGTLPEFLIVSPRGVDSWFVDSYDGRSRYERFLTEDLVPFVDGKYRTTPERRARLAAGISMGGYGAIHLALLHPEVFVAVGGLSPAIQQLDWRGVQALPFFIRPSMTRVFGRSAQKNNLRQNDLYDILLSHPKLPREAPEVLVRCGLQDKWRLGEISGFFKKFLDAVGVSNDVVVEPGAHDWSYWSGALPKLIADLAKRLSPSGAMTR